MVLFCINLDGGFVVSSGFVAWSRPTKVCGAICYEVTFLRVKAFISARLFQLLGAETHVLKKVGVQNAFGSAQNATFWKKLRFVPRLRTRKTIWSPGGP